MYSFPLSRECGCCLLIFTDWVTSVTRFRSKKPNLQIATIRSLQ